MNLLLSVFLLAAASPVTVRVSPQPTYVEADTRGQSLNVDLIVHNGASEVVDLDEVKVSVFDSAGKLVVRRFIDGNGTRPSIRTADVGEIAAGADAMLFNPFATFDADVDLHTVRFDLSLSSKDGSHTYTSSAEVEPRVYAQRAKLVLPIASRMIVYDGHDLVAHHRRWDYALPPIQALGFKTNFMRYSYDFVPVDDNGDMANGAEEKNENWFGFGKPVRAVADGEIVAVKDDQPDDRTFDPSTIAKDGPMKIWGNYVVVKHADGEYSLFGHIHQGSSRVKVGQRVKRGEPLASIGAAGSSKFPHLHYELQTTSDVSGEGLPSQFENFDRVRGAKRLHVTRGYVNSGEIIESR